MGKVKTTVHGDLITFAAPPPTEKQDMHRIYAKKLKCDIYTQYSTKCHLMFLWCI